MLLDRSKTLFLRVVEEVKRKREKGAADDDADTPFENLSLQVQKSHFLELRNRFKQTNFGHFSNAIILKEVALALDLRCYFCLSPADFAQFQLYKLPPERLPLLNILRILDPKVFCFYQTFRSSEGLFCLCRTDFPSLETVV